MPPLCLLNLIELDPPRNGGASRVALEVTRLLLDRGRRAELELVVAVGRRFAAQYRAWVGDADAPVLPCLDEPGPVLQAVRPHLIVSPLFGPSPLHRVAALRSVPHVVSMPDAYALDVPAAFPVQEVERRREMYASLTGVTRVVTLSQYSRRRLLHHLSLDPDAVTVVPPGVDAPPVGTTPPAVGGRFVLYPARDWSHKRHAFLLATMAAVWRSRPELTLVLTGWHEGPPAGPGPGAPGAGRHGRVLDLGYVDEAALWALYRAADALVFPSSFEGFGLPILEAMAAGCPVVCSSLDVLRELTADAALVPAADSPEAWARTILAELPARRAELRQAGLARAAGFSLARMRSGWCEQLRAAGLGPGGGDRDGTAAVPLRAVERELASWADLARHADERLEVIASLRRVIDRRRVVSALEALARRAVRGLRRARPGRPTSDPRRLP